VPRIWPPRSQGPRASGWTRPRRLPFNVAWASTAGEWKASARPWPRKRLRRALKPQILEDAERLLDGTGWLPEPLRTQETESADATDGNTAEDTEAPPAFLADDEKSTSDEESDEPAVIAAE
jgi:hypothetical protein